MELWKKGLILTAWVPNPKLEYQNSVGVHAAVEIANRLEGRSKQQIEFSDITSDLRNRSDDELRFHLQHDRWPTDEEKALLLAASPHPTT